MNNKKRKTNPIKQTHKNDSKNENELITKIMSKYNVSYEEAHIILNKLIKNNLKTEKTRQKVKNKTQPIKNNNTKNTKKNISLFKEKSVEKNYETDMPQDELINKKTNNNNSMKKSNSNNKSKTPKNNLKTENVDSILSKIVPDYNKQLSIELENVSLTFDIELDKVDTLKETFIRTIKRDKANKMKIKALQNVSFKIYQGEKVGIIGYNGAGKSTLLSVITGIYPPDKGTVKTYGNISPLLALGSGFDFNYSGRKNIYLNGAVLGYERKFLEERENTIIEFSELGNFIDIPIKNYSSGMLAKLSFSIATTVEPDILIIDEILGVGDVNFQKKSRDKIRSLMDGGTTVLLVSHSIPQIRELCDKAIWIDNGKIKSIGEVNKICDLYLKDAEKATNEQLANIQFK